MSGRRGYCRPLATKKEAAQRIGLDNSTFPVFSIQPRGLKRAQAAAYVGVSPSLFDEMVADGRMPSPRMVNSRMVWDRHELDFSFDALPHKEQRDPWDCVLNA